jgi:predicted transcriptional regulator
MAREVRIVIGVRDAGLEGFVGAWHRANAGDSRTERVLAFESWEAFASLLTTDRIALLRHLNSRPGASVDAWAEQLGRKSGDVFQDIRILEQVGLLEFSEGWVRATADKLTAEIVL